MCFVRMMCYFCLLKSILLVEINFYLLKSFLFAVILVLVLVKLYFLCIFIFYKLIFYKKSYKFKKLNIVIKKNKKCIKKIFVVNYDQ